MVCNTNYCCVSELGVSSTVLTTAVFEMELDVADSPNLWSLMSRLPKFAILPIAVLNEAR